MEIRYKMYEPTARQKLFHSCPATYTLFGGSKGCGKEQSINSLILTPFGYRKMGEMKVGTQVSNPDGSVSRVIGVYPQGRKDIYRMRFDDGASCECGLEHLWKYKIVGKTRFHKKPREERVTEWKIGNTKGLQGLLKTGKRILIPLTEPVEFTITSRKADSRWEIHPYLLGVALGDGSIRSSLTITTADYEIIGKLEALGYSYSSVNQKSGNKAKNYNYKGLGEKFKKIGLLGKTSVNKFIPERYKEVSLDYRWELIRGLMDCDGYIDKGGHASYCTISEQLALDVQWIARSLGFKASITNKIPTFKYKGIKKKGQKAYNVWIKGNKHEDLFSIERKRIRGKLEYNNGLGYRTRKIVGIEESGESECQCIRVDNPNGLYITDDFIVTHNTVALVNEVAILSIEYPGNRGFMGRKQAVDFRDTTLMTFLENIPGNLYKHVEHKKYIEWLNGSLTIYGGLDNREDVNKFNSMELGYFAIDQAEEIGKDDFAALIGALNRYKLPNGTRPRYRGILSCNPAPCWLKQDFVLNPAPGFAFIPALPADNPHLPKQYYKNLEYAYRHRQNILNAYLHGSWDDIEGGDMVILYSDVQSAVDRVLPKPLGKPFTIVVCDPATNRGIDETVIYVMTDGAIIHQEIYGFRDTMETVGRMILMYKQYNAEFVVTDADGIGAPICDRLGELSIPHYGLRAAEKSTEPDRYRNMKAEMWGNAADMFHNQEVSIPNDPTLKGQLGMVKFKSISSEGLIEIETKDEVRRRNSNASPDRADAVVMGLWATKNLNSRVFSEIVEKYERRIQRNFYNRGRMGYG